MLAAIPLLVVPVGAYAVLALTLGGGLFSIHAQALLTRPLFHLTTAGGGVWPVSAADLLLAAALIVAFIDLIRGMGDRRAAMVNHALSIALFVACLAAMLVAPAFANSTFFLITLMVLLDLAAGFIATMGQDADERA
ncbi:MAG: hypothetical protein JWO83_2519 [Caulobacteraceae bacterium]|jgi:hypothetical protein|nr:hypothetical protein [Caulobacteraceae bacterium]